MSYFFTETCNPDRVAQLVGCVCHKAVAATGEMRNWAVGNTRAQGAVVCVVSFERGVTEGTEMRFACRFRQLVMICAKRVHAGKKGRRRVTGFGESNDIRYIYFVYIFVSLRIHTAHKRLEYAFLMFVGTQRN